jgi:hypothetical protein
VEDADRGQWISVAVLSDGRPVAAWYNRSSGGLEFGLGKVVDGVVSWSIEKVDGFADETGLDSGNRGTHTGIAVGPDDRIWIVYRDVTNKTLRYAMRDTVYNPGDYAEPVKTVWKTDLLDVGAGASPDTGEWTSLAIGADGNPVVVYRDVGKRQLRVAHWGGTSFSATTVDVGQDYIPEDTAGSPVTANVGEFARLVFGPDGKEYIAYYDRAWGRLRLAVGDASGYALGDVDDEADVGQWPSMLFTSDGTLHLAYHDVTNQDLKHAWGHPGAFETEIVDSGDYRGADSEIFRFGDMLSILYFDGYDNDLLLARRTGETWALSQVAGGDAALGFHNNVFVTGGRTYAACYDYTGRGPWAGALE